MRDLIYERLDGSDWMDHLFLDLHNRRVPNTSSYQLWLRTLSDEDLLETYDRVREARHEMARQ